MVGRFEDGRTILAETRAQLADRGATLLQAAISGIESASVELLAGDPTAAAELAQEGCRLIEKLEEQGFLSTAAATLAEALYALDRLDEADAWAARAKALGGSDDAFTQISWRQVRAKILARHAAHAESERLAREAVAIGEATDFLDGQGDAHATLAEVLLLAGKPHEAIAAFHVGLERYKRKENRVSAQRVQMRLTELQTAAR